MWAGTLPACFSCSGLQTEFRLAFTGHAGTSGADRLGNLASVSAPRCVCDSGQRGTASRGPGYRDEKLLGRGPGTLSAPRRQARRHPRTGAGESNRSRPARALSPGMSSAIEELVGDVGLVSGPGRKVPWLRSRPQLTFQPRGRTPRAQRQPSPQVPSFASRGGQEISPRVARFNELCACEV
jgi:hypothetical protein